MCVEDQDSFIFYFLYFLFILRLRDLYRIVIDSHIYGSENIPSVVDITPIP